jgi:Holliday junction resolvasome RuvABC endonuclease subunit
LEADMNARTWIGIDPSIAALGFAVLRRLDPSAQPVLIEIGTLVTKLDKYEEKLADRARRIAELGRGLMAVLDRHPDLDAAYIESLVLNGRDGRVSVQTLGRVRGLVEGLCLARGLELSEVEPKVLKMAVAQRKDASKEDVARVVRRFYRTTETNNNATDSLAVAHVGAYRFGHGVTISSGVVQFRPPTDDDLNLD